MDICEVFHFWGQGKWPVAIIWVELGRLLIPTEASQPLANYFPAIFQLLGLSAELETTFHVHSKHSTDSSWISQHVKVELLVFCSWLEGFPHKTLNEEGGGYPVLFPWGHLAMQQHKSSGLHSAKDGEKKWMHIISYMYHWSQASHSPTAEFQRKQQPFYPVKNITSKKWV